MLCRRCGGGAVRCAGLGVAGRNGACMVTSPLSNSENFRHIERTYDNMMPEDDFDESESEGRNTKEAFSG